jgi:hypothetical protein
MSIKLVILKSGEELISDVKEIMNDGDNVVGYLLNDPCVVICDDYFLKEEDSEGEQVQISLRSWLVFSKDTKIPIRPDGLISIVEPIDDLKKMYEEKVNGESNQIDSTDEQ